MDDMYAPPGNGDCVAISHSIVICTAGRMEELFTTLHDLVQMITYPRITEVIIVNNGQHSATSKIEHKMQSLCSEKSTHWTVVYEQRPGLSNARNAALAVASGEIVTFLDDDASPKTTTWQGSLLRIFHQYPDVGICGGPSELVAPDGYNTHPWWRSTYTDELFSCHNGTESGRCEPDKIYGLNASYRKTCLEGHKFNPYLGWNNSRKHPFCSEETLLNKQIHQSGWCAWFEKDAVVLHRINPQRYNTRWLLRRCYIRGRSYGLLLSIDQNTDVSLFEALRNIAVSGVKLVVRMLEFRLNRGFYQLCRIYDNVGLVSFLLQNKGVQDSASTATDDVANK